MDKGRSLVTVQLKEVAKGCISVFLQFLCKSKIIIREGHRGYTSRHITFAIKPEELASVCGVDHSE